MNVALVGIVRILAGAHRSGHTYRRARVCERAAMVRKSLGAGRSGYSKQTSAALYS